jgi:hypothetical protein
MMSSWDQLRFKREQLRVFFWAARQAIVLFVLVVSAVSMSVEVALNGNASLLEQFFRLVGG